VVFLHVRLICINAFLLRQTFIRQGESHKARTFEVLVDRVWNTWLQSKDIKSSLDEELNASSWNDMYRAGWTGDIWEEPCSILSDRGIKVWMSGFAGLTQRVFIKFSRNWESSLLWVLRTDVSYLHGTGKITDFYGVVLRIRCKSVTLTYVQVMWRGIQNAQDRGGKPCVGKRRTLELSYSDISRA